MPESCRGNSLQGGRRPGDFTLLTFNGERLRGTGAPDALYRATVAVTLTEARTPARFKWRVVSRERFNSSARSIASLPFSRSNGVCVPCETHLEPL